MWSCGMWRAVREAVVLAAAVMVLAACGGGADDEAAVAEPLAGVVTTAVDAADPEGPPAAEARKEALVASALVAATAYTVAPDEVLVNGSFGNGLTGWTASDATLVASPLRSGGRSLSVGWRAQQALGGGKLVAGRSYTLTVKARNDNATGSTQIVVRFLRPGGEVYRSYAATVASTAWQDYRVEFTAPAYTALAELGITASGTRTLVDVASLKMRAAIAQTETMTSLVGSYVPAGYVLAFNDEFSGGTLNRSKWFTRYIHGGGTLDRLGDEQQRYRDNANHPQAGGLLSLTARRVSSNDPQGIDYESGMIRSDWTTRYGYFEARVKMPGGLGVWPAFWLVSDVSSTGALSWPPEIDIFEFVNNGVEDTVNMLHSGVVTPAGVSSPLSYADPAYNTDWTYYRAPFNFNEAWHTIGAEWTPAGVTAYVDGKKIYTRGYLWNFPDGTPAGPAHILLNLAVGGSWAGRHGIDAAAFPQALQINWVRAYKKAE